MGKSAVSLISNLLSNLGKELWEIEDKGIREVKISTLAIISDYLRRYFNIDFFKMLSEEDRMILEKRGCLLLAPFDDGIERIYTARDICFSYKRFHYDKDVLRKSMTLDGADSGTIDNEFLKLDNFLRTDVISSVEDPDIEFTEEQYRKAKTYIDVERFIDSFKEDISLNPDERINVIANLVDYTLTTFNEDDENLPITKLQSAVSEKVLSIINDSIVA